MQASTARARSDLYVASSTVRDATGAPASRVGVAAAPIPHPFDGRQRLYPLAELEQQLAERNPGAHSALVERYPQGAAFVDAAAVQPDLADAGALKAAARDGSSGLAFRMTTTGDVVPVLAKPSAIADGIGGLALLRRIPHPDLARATALLQTNPGRLGVGAIGVVAVAAVANGMIGSALGNEPKAAPELSPAPSEPASTSEPAAEPKPKPTSTPEPSEAPKPAPPKDPVASEERRARIAAGVKEAIAASGVGASTSVVVRDSADDSIIASHQPDRTTPPASVQKALTATAALAAFGPDHRFKTSVHAAGEVRDGTLHGDLWIVGGGDPRLGRGHLDDIAAKVKAAGITSVTGRVMIDDTMFDAHRGVPGWAPDATNYALPLGALLLYDRQEFQPESGGSEDPGLYAGQHFRTALAAAGVRVAGAVGRGAAPDGAREVAGHDSPPLSDIVTRMNHVSSNTIAELLAKHVGVHRGGDGSTAAAAKGMQAELAELGVPMAGIGMHDGSGLSLHNRLSAEAVTAMFEVAASDAAVAPALLKSLPKGGQPETSLAGTFVALGDRIAAKPGGLNRTSSIAGFAYGGEDRHRYSFAVIASNSEHGLDVPAAVALQERIAKVIAEA